MGAGRSADIAFWGNSGGGWRSPSALLPVAPMRARAGREASRCHGGSGQTLGQGLRLIWRMRLLPLWPTLPGSPLGFFHAQDDLVQCEERSTLGSADPGTPAMGKQGQSEQCGLVMSIQQGTGVAVQGGLDSAWTRRVSLCASSSWSHSASSYVPGAVCQEHHCLLSVDCGSLLIFIPIFFSSRPRNVTRSRACLFLPDADTHSAVTELCHTAPCLCHLGAQ